MQRTVVMMIRRMIYGLVLAAGIAVSGVSPAAAQAAHGPMLDLTVHNETGVPIVALFVFPSGQDQGTDRLDAQVLAPGAFRRVALGHGSDCVYDVVARLANGRTERRPAHNACRAQAIRLGVR